MFGLGRSHVVALSSPRPHRRAGPLHRLPAGRAGGRRDRRGAAGGKPGPAGGALRGDEPGPERSLTHFAYNRGKRSIVLDLGLEADRARFLQLVAGADVVLDSAEPGELAGARPGSGRPGRRQPGPGPRLGHRLRPGGAQGPLAGHRPHAHGQRCRPGPDRRRRPTTGAGQRPPGLQPGGGQRSGGHDHGPLRAGPIRQGPARGRGRPAVGAAGHPGRCAGRRASTLPWPPAPQGAPRWGRSSCASCTPPLTASCRSPTSSAPRSARPRPG